MSMSIRLLLATLFGFVIFLFWYESTFSVGFLAYILTFICGSVLFFPNSTNEKKRFKFDVFNPSIGFVILMLLYSISGAILAETTGYTNYGYFVSNEILSEYYLSCIIGFCGFLCGCYCGAKIKIFERVVKVSEISNPQFFKILKNLCLVSLILLPFYFFKFNFFAVRSYAEQALSLRIERMSDTASGIKDIIFVDVPVTFILCYSILVIFKKKGITKIYFLAIYLAFLFTNFLSGWRGNLMWGIILILIYYHYHVKPVGIFRAIFVGIFIYLIVNILSIVRSTNNISEMTNIFSSEFSKTGLATISLSNSGELLVGTNLMRTIGGLKSGEVKYTYGLSIVSEFMMFIPLAIYPSRPLPLAVKFVKDFYPGVYEEGGGYGFFCLQEGYYSFGLFGIFVFLFFYGFLLQKVYLFFKTKSNNSFFTLWYSVFYYTMVIAAVRSGIIGNIKAFLIVSIPFIIILIFQNFKQLVNWKKK